MNEAEYNDLRVRTESAVTLSVVIVVSCLPCPLMFFSVSCCDPVYSSYVSSLSHMLSFLCEIFFLIRVLPSLMSSSIIL